MAESAPKINRATVLHVVGGLNRIGGIMHVARSLIGSRMPGYQHFLWKHRDYQPSENEPFVVALGKGEKTDTGILSDFVGAMRDVLPLLRWVRKQERVILHAHTRFGILTSAVVSQLTGCPLVVHLHGFQSRIRMYRTLLKVTGATPIFNSIKTCEYYGFDPQRSTIITPTIVWSTEPSPTGGVARFVAAGAFAPVKQLEVIVKAFMKMQGSGLDARLALIGLSDSPLAPEYQRQIAQMCKGNSAIELIKEDPRWAERLTENDVFVHAAERESFGIVILEAFAKGCRVVASNRTFLDGLDEPVRSQGVFRCANVTVSDYEQQMRKALDHRLSAVELFNLRRSQAERFSLKTALLKLSTVYESVLQ